MSSNLKGYTHVDLLFPSEYLRGADLRGKDHTLTITKIDPRYDLQTADGSKTSKPVLFFEETDKKMVLNKTNGRMIAALLGVNPQRWLGHAVIVGTSKVTAFGKEHDALRVRNQLPKKRTKRGK